MIVNVKHAAKRRPCVFRLAAAVIIVDHKMLLYEDLPVPFHIFCTHRVTFVLRSTLQSSQNAITLQLS